MSSFATPPEKLIGPDGRPNFGVFSGPIADVNLDEFDYRKLGRFFSRFGKRGSRLCKKRWQYLGAFDENLVVGAAVIDLGYIGSAFAYVYERASQKLSEVNLIDPFAAKTEQSPSSIAGSCRLKVGQKSVSQQNDLGQGRRRVLVETPEFGIDVALTEDPSQFQSTSFCIRNGLRGFNYTHKAAGIGASGKVRVRDSEYELTSKALGVLDWTAGTAMHETFWNWASAAGYDEKGRVIGINLVSGINETGHTENTIWVAGRPVKVDVVNFEYNTEDFFAPWKITSADRIVDLTFMPEQERKQNQNYLVIASKFRQPFGRFHGEVKVDGKSLKIDNLYGFAEEHYVKW